MKHKTIAKHLLSVCLCIALALICLLGLTVNANAATLEDLTYEISDGHVTITDCSTDASGELIIPDNIEGYPVISIGNSAFYDCDSLTSVTIPNGVTVICENAFSYCIGLTSITIPDGLTDIGESAFSHCISLTSITIPDSVTTISAGAFFECSSLTSVTIPDCIKSIEDGTFNLCTNLTSVIIPDSVITIGEWAFAECVSLTSITIPDNISSIGDYAFCWCNNLTSVTIPDSVTTFGEYTFSHCSNLTKIFFQGDAPYSRFFNSPFGSHPVFYKVNAIAYYPAGNDTWTEDMMQDYGGDITWIAYNPFKINKQPTTQKIAEGKTAKFTVTATGDNFTYQWQYRTSSSGSWKNASAAGNKTATLSVPATISRTGYQYRCVVTDEDGNKIYSNAAYLYVLGIKTQPVSQKLKEGKTAKFTVSATGASKKYQWQYRTSSTGSWKNASATGNKTATLSVPATVSRSGYQYRCKVTDSAGNSIYTKTVNLYVLGIKTQPTSKTVVAGKTAKFTVAATGAGKTYQWQYRTSSSGNWKNASATGNKTATLSVSATTAKHGYQYRCKITDSAGNTVYTKTINLYVLGIKTQPTNKTVKAGATAKFTVAATGKGLTYQWQYKTSSTASWKNVSASSGKTASYSLTAQSRHNGYTYRCRIKDSAGNVIYSNIVKLTVKK